MLVPAAGAVLLIIQSIQAAWGTIKRVLAALDKFMTFLRAVKSGAGGPAFAEAVAAGAVAAIEFVANFLLKKLKGPASKVGGKIREIAKRIGQKLAGVGKKIFKGLKNVGGGSSKQKIKRGFQKVREKLFGPNKPGARSRRKRRRRKRQSRNSGASSARSRPRSLLYSGRVPAVSG